MKYQMEQSGESVQISIVTAAAAATTATTAENPPRCTAIYFSTHKIVKRIALVFSNIYRFACSSFAVVVCILASFFFLLVVCVLLFSLFAFFSCSLLIVHDALFTTVVILLCGRERKITLTVCAV